MRIGPTFAAELRAAGATLEGLSWSENGEINYADDYPGADKATVQQVFEAHQPQCKAAADLAILAEIDRLEREQQMPRLQREFMLPLMVSLAAGSGVTEPQLYAANIGYKKLKDFNAQIVALRAQL